MKPFFWTFGHISHHTGMYMHHFFLNFAKHFFLIDDKSRDVFLFVTDDKWVQNFCYTMMMCAGSEFHLIFLCSIPCKTFLHGIKKGTGKRIAWQGNTILLQNWLIQIESSTILLLTFLKTNGGWLAGFFFFFDYVQMAICFF